MNDKRTTPSRFTAFGACLLALGVNGAACVLVSLAVQEAVHSVGALFVAIEGVAVYQFAYLWPWWRSAARRGDHDVAFGVKLAAGVTALVGGVCWSWTAMTF
jgi:hypothetical protein